MPHLDELRDEVVENAAAIVIFQNVRFRGSLALDCVSRVPPGGAEGDTKRQVLLVQELGEALRSRLVSSTTVLLRE